MLVYATMYQKQASKVQASCHIHSYMTADVKCSHIHCCSNHTKLSQLLLMEG